MDYDIDQLAEPINITIGGRKFEVSKITADTLEKVTQIDSKGMDAPVKQLAVLLGCKEEFLKDIDIRKIGKALKIIQENVLKDIDDPKNS